MMRIYVQSGSFVDFGQAFVFTGNLSGSAWEITPPMVAGQRIHGIARSRQDQESYVSAVELLGVGPRYVPLAGTVSAGDLITATANRTFRRKQQDEVTAGIVLVGGDIGTTAIAFLYVE
jgi:hypothetical protein